MRVDGEAAKSYRVVRLDNFEDVNHGDLIEADDQTGRVVWIDTVGERKEITLGAHNIRIVTVARR